MNHRSSRLIVRLNGLKISFIHNPNDQKSNVPNPALRNTRVADLEITYRVARQIFDCLVDNQIHSTRAHTHSLTPVRWPEEEEPVDKQDNNYYHDRLISTRAPAPGRRTGNENRPVPSRRAGVADRRREGARRRRC